MEDAKLPEEPTDNYDKEKIAVMVVDDSAVVRGMLTRYLEDEPDIAVVLSASNGAMAVDILKKRVIDVVLLDIQMPVMDGMEALPKLLEQKDDLQVIVVSTLTHRGAKITFEALEKGAAECLCKPTSAEADGKESFRRELVEKTRALGRRALRRRLGDDAVKKLVAKTPTEPGTEPEPQEKAPARPAQKDAPPSPRSTPDAGDDFELRKASFTGRPEAIAIGASTGGPQALLDVYGRLIGGLKQPVFITQHMPEKFTTILAENLTMISDTECVEAADGMAVEGGKTYIAPGGLHMVVRPGRDGGPPTIGVNTDPPENFCRPSVDVMVRSMIEVYGEKILGVMMTGMGHDGLDAFRALAENGSPIIAQDKDSSVVWGMPGSVAKAGLACEVMTLNDLANGIRSYAER